MVTVTDSATPTPATKTATVTVTTAATNVDYTITVGHRSLRAARAESPFRRDTFTVQNIGAAGGALAAELVGLYLRSATFNTAGMQILCNGVDRVGWRHLTSF